MDVCLPTDRHFDVVMQCLQAGKPVLVEKPISVSQQEAETMVRTAAEKQVPLFVAHVLPFFPEFRFAAEAIQDQRYGRLLAANFKRVIARPEWSSDMSDFRKLGGWGIDLHIHDNHFIAHACGRPAGVFSRGLLQDGLVNHVHSSYLYPQGPAVTCVSGALGPKLCSSHMATNCTSNVPQCCLMPGLWQATGLSADRSACWAMMVH